MGTLDGVRIIEMAGIGPAPFCGMLLADMGADVLRIDRLVASEIGIPVPPKFDLLNRNKRSVAVDLKTFAGRDLLLHLVRRAHILIEGFRPNVMERLGLGPDVCLKANGCLVYGRMTGWGQDGPLSQAASHDINYIALGGALYAIGACGEAPVIPLNLIGDFGGGALYLAMGVLAAMISARATGKGQVVDAAVSDGVANLLTMHYGFLQAGKWSLDRGSNVTDGGAPFYDVYRTRDGGYISIGAVEGKFFRELLSRIGLDESGLPEQLDRTAWDGIRRRLKEIFLTCTRSEWDVLLEGTDACYAPVLDMEEAARHPHNIARRTHLTVNGVTNPAPAPRFSLTPSSLRKAPSPAGADTESALLDWDLSASEFAMLRRAGIVA